MTTETSIPAAPVQDLVIPDDILPLGLLFMRAARRDPGKVGLVFPGERLTYGELSDRVWQRAKGLVGLGVQPGDHVGMLMTNHPELVVTHYAALLIGATMVPINARYRTTELDYIVSDADLTVLITTDAADDHVDFAQLVHDALPGVREAADPYALELPNHPTLRSIVLIGAREPAGFVTQRDFDAAGEPVTDAEITGLAQRVLAGSTALILYTSGTTAAPRGAMHTHESFGRAWMNVASVWSSTSEDRHWSALPLFHVTALGCMTWVHGVGATFFSDFAFDAGRTVAVLNDERITEFFPAYPPVMEAVITHPDFAAADVSHVRVMNNVAPPETLRKFQSRFPDTKQVTVYGGTEGGCVSITRPEAPLEVRLNTCGTPLPGLQMRVCGPDDEILPPNTEGELQYRGINTFHGYYNHPEKTYESFARGGWYRSGDLGTMDETGACRFLGRIKETLKVGGENVAPQEIEALLSVHPAVTLVAVVGIPDERLVEVAAAFVEVIPGAEVTEAELIEHCKGKIASFKVPRLVRFIANDEWPMSTTKIQRTKLRERLLEELGLSD